MKKRPEKRTQRDIIWKTGHARLSVWRNVDSTKKKKKKKCDPEPFFLGNDQLRFCRKIGGKSSTFVISKSCAVRPSKGNFSFYFYLLSWSSCLGFHDMKTTIQSVFRHWKQMFRDVGEGNTNKYLIGFGSIETDSTPLSAQPPLVKCTQTSCAFDSNDAIVDVITSQNDMWVSPSGTSSSLRCLQPSVWITVVVHSVSISSCLWGWKIA